MSNRLRVVLYTHFHTALKWSIICWTHYETKFQYYTRWWLYQGRGSMHSTSRQSRRHQWSFYFLWENFPWGKFLEQQSLSAVVLDFFFFWRFKSIGRPWDPTNRYKPGSYSECIIITLAIIIFLGTYCYVPRSSYVTIHFCPLHLPQIVHFLILTTPTGTEPLTLTLPATCLNEPVFQPKKLAAYKCFCYNCHLHYSKSD